MEKTRLTEELKVGMVVKTHLKPILVAKYGRKNALEVEVLDIRRGYFIAQPKKFEHKLNIPFGGIVEVCKVKTFEASLAKLEQKYNG